MNAFEFSLPEPNKAEQLGGLSEDARASLANMAINSVDNYRQTKLETRELSELPEEIFVWAVDELNGVEKGTVRINTQGLGTLKKWQKYEEEIGMEIPSNFTELFFSNPNLVSTLSRLYEAKQALTLCGELTPDGHNLGETMKLLVMPWQAFKDNQHMLVSWLENMRAKQQAAYTDMLDSDLVRFLLSDFPIYRDPTKPGRFLSTSEYLTQKITQDGPFGVILIQTSDQAGVKRLLDDNKIIISPNFLTDSGRSNFWLANLIVDGMGILEWLSLTLQENPKEISSQDRSWALANRVALASHNCKTTPFCMSTPFQSQILLGYADDSDAFSRPRLAVM